MNIITAKYLEKVVVKNKDMKLKKKTKADVRIRVKTIEG